MSGANSAAEEPSGGPENTPNVPTQRRGSCACGHQDAEHHHGRVGDDSGACRRSRLRGGFGLAEQLVVALRRGR